MKQQTQIIITRDGELDLMYLRRQQVKKLVQVTGRLLYKGLEGTVNVLDEFAQAGK